MWAQLFDRDMLNFLIACACFGAAWGFFDLAVRSAQGSPGNKLTIKPNRRKMS